MGTVRKRRWRNAHGETRQAWQARYVGPDGNRHSHQFRRQVDAQAWLEQEVAKQVRGDWTDPRSGKLLFNDWWHVWEGTRVHLRPSTRTRDRSYAKNHLLPRFGAMWLTQIQPTEIRRWVADLTQSGLAPATVRKAYQLFSAALEAAADDGLIANNPARKAKLPRVQAQETLFLTVEEVEKLAATMPNRYAALVLLAAYTGLRWGELAGLRVANLDLLRRRLTVVETLVEESGKLYSGEPKTRASRRTVSIPHVVCDKLAAHLTRYPTTPDGLVFRSSEGGPLRRTNFRRRVWIPACEAAELRGLRFHDLRHTHASLLIAQGEHPKLIQSRLGHASIRTTFDTYGHLFDGLDEDAADRLHLAIVGSGRDITGTSAPGVPMEHIQTDERTA